MSPKEVLDMLRAAGLLDRGALLGPGGETITAEIINAVAQGGPTDISQTQFRITLEGPGLADVLEMEFTVVYGE